MADIDKSLKGKEDDKFDSYPDDTTCVQTKAILLDSTGTEIDNTNPLPASITEVPPTDSTKNNPSYVITYTGDDLTRVDMTIATVVYRKTLTWTGTDLTAISSWSVV